MVNVNEFVELMKKQSEVRHEVYKTVNSLWFGQTATYKGVWIECLLNGQYRATFDTYSLVECTVYDLTDKLTSYLFAKEVA